MASKYPSASASATPREEHQYKALRNFLNVAIVIGVLAIAAILPGACKRQQQYDAANAQGWCERGYISQCDSFEVAHAN